MRPRDDDDEPYQQSALPPGSPQWYGALHQVPPGTVHARSPQKVRHLAPGTPRYGTPLKVQYLVPGTPRYQVPPKATVPCTRHPQVRYSPGTSPPQRYGTLRRRGALMKRGRVRSALGGRSAGAAAPGPTSSAAAAAAAASASASCCCAHSPCSLVR